MNVPDYIVTHAYVKLRPDGSGVPVGWVDGVNLPNTLPADGRPVLADDYPEYTAMVTRYRRRKYRFWIKERYYLYGDSGPGTVNLPDLRGRVGVRLVP